jgi:hypothetical protein
VSGVVEFASIEVSDRISDCSRFILPCCHETLESQKDHTMECKTVVAVGSILMKKQCTTSIGRVD